MDKWNQLPQKEGRIKLKSKQKTLVDVFKALIEDNDPLIKYLPEDELMSLTNRSEFDVVQPYVPVKIYLTHEDKKNDNYLYFLFANHGPIYYANGEVLENYKLEDINYFWNFKLSHFDEQPKEFIYNHYFILSDDTDAIEEWDGEYNFEDIFDTYGLNGADGGYAGFVGLFLQRD